MPLDISDYQATFGKAGKKDILTFKVEVNEYSETAGKTISDKLLMDPVVRKNMDDGVLDLAPVEPVKQGNLTRMNRAKKLIIDIR